MTFLKSIKLAGLLSFPPNSPTIGLAPLNVLIGPNASGKSNLVEAVGILRATPTGLAQVMRAGGTATHWIWKGEPSANQASLEVVVEQQEAVPDIRYRLSFVQSGMRMEVVEEVVEESEKREPNEQDVSFFYRLYRGQAVLNVRQTTTTTTPPPLPPSVSIIETPPPITSGQGVIPKSGQRAFRLVARESLVPDESVLSQFKDPDAYPELFKLAHRFARIQTFRDWSFGRNAPLRGPQKTDLPAEDLLEGADNLALILNELQHSNALAEFNRLLRRFLPRYQRFSTPVRASAMEFYLHEDGLQTPVPATRLSDGTIRFMAILALLLSPNPPPLLCIEEPELGLHPDAVSLLAELLVTSSVRTQLIVTTHSDALVSALSENASSVLVCEHRGGTIFERVDPDRLRHWLEKYRLGDVWRIGELGGNP